MKIGSRISLISTDKNSASNSGDSGTIMLEATFCMVVCIIIMALLLSVGFYFYQLVMVHIVANETAEYVASTYKFATLRDSAQLEAADIANIGMYRYWFSREDELTDAAATKGTNYANSRLSKTTLAVANTMPTVTVTSVDDDIGRNHYEVTVTQEYTFLMGDLLELIGLTGTQQMSATSYVRGVDVSHYINSVKTWESVADLFAELIPGQEMVDSILSTGKSICKLFESLFGSDSDYSTAESSWSGGGRGSPW